jgi:hypothetical protein
MEVLVARHPAIRRSDIQKVRTVVRSELSHLVDVVVFPSNGQYPLAGKLQGGDYDGDLFWVCWQPTLVRPFQNAPAPVQPPDPAKYGIETRSEKLKDIMNTNNPEEVDKFLRKAFEFHNNPSLLGFVTTFAEKQAYSEKCIFSKTLEGLYDMHDLLVDASKQGYVFTNANFDRYVARLRKQPKQPAYKAAMDECANTKEAGEVEKLRKKKYSYDTDNALDYLYFKIVRAHNIETMNRVKSDLSKATEQDKILLYPINHFRERNKTVVKDELLSLTTKLNELYRCWNTIWHRGFTVERSNALLDDCYQKYRAIQPDNPNDPDIQPLVEPYLATETLLWDMIKASALYAQFHWPEKSNFVFQMAGRELTRLKADIFPHTRPIISVLRTNMKPKPIKAPIQYDEEDEEDVFEKALEELVLE